MPELARTLLAPVLLVQGRRMFRTMPRLPPPSGDPTGTVGEGPPLRLLVVGDSAAAGFGAETLDEALPGRLAARLAARGRRVTWSLFARFGSTAARTLAYVRKQDAFDVDLAVVSLGLNDLIAGVSQAAWLADMEALAGELRARFGAPLVVASGLPPIGGFPALPQPMRWVMGRSAASQRSRCAPGPRPPRASPPSRPASPARGRTSRAMSPWPSSWPPTASTPARASTTSGRAASSRPSATASSGPPRRTAPPTRRASGAPEAVASEASA